ncbi:unnamed protein product [Ranitomeya imitator]|uniref:Uncharacterized protein n=1 Tax=Ranitomeya imitator TaxID=111125 RepID=A0ABN9M3Q6_9NEOB|nr:unnamed protein product [Ranitomeya imitator]
MDFERTLGLKSPCDLRSPPTPAVTSPPPPNNNLFQHGQPGVHMMTLLAGGAGVAECTRIPAFGAGVF